MKFAEVREQLEYPAYIKWIFRNFNLRETAAKEYLQIGRKLSNYVANGDVEMPTSKRGFRQKHFGTKMGERPGWTKEIREELKDIDFAAMRRAELARAEETKVRRELAVRIIKIGYRTLATKMHPDKGRTTEGMA